MLGISKRRWILFCSPRTDVRFLNFLPTLATFEGLSFALRVMEGLGMAGAFTASTAIVAHALPEKAGTAVVSGLHIGGRDRLRPPSSVGVGCLFREPCANTVGPS